MTHWIRNLSKVGVLLAVVVGFVLLLNQPAAAAGKPLQWPEGWSKPILLTQGDSHQHGFRAAAAAPDLFWLVTVAEEQLTVLKCSIDGNRKEVIARQQFTGKLLDYAAVAYEGRLYLVWADGKDGTALWYRSFDLEGAISSPVKVWETERYIDSVAVTADRAGKLFLAWSGLAAGEDNYSIYLQERDIGTGAVDETLVVSDRDRYLDKEPKLAAGSDGTVHIVYLQQEQQSGDIIYRAYRTLDRQLSEPIKLGSSSGKIEHMPVLLPRPDGTADVLWRKGIVVRGVLRDMAVAHARISVEAGLSEYQPLSRFRGYVTAVSGAAASNGSILAVWVIEDEYLQLAYAELSQSGEVTKEGLVTADAGHHFEPQPLWLGSHRAVVYYKQRDDGDIDIYLVNDVNPAQQTLAFRLGLDEANPAADFLFQFVNTALSAAVLALLSFPVIALGILCAWVLNKTGLFSDSRLGGLALHAACFAVIALVKRTGSFLYYGAQFMPGLAGAIAVLFSGIFALGAVVLFKLERNDLLSILLSCYLFVFLDNLCALMAKGLGIW